MGNLYCIQVLIRKAQQLVDFIEPISYNIQYGGVIMINSHVATAVVLRDLNCFSLETINDRILLQKKVYLAQDIGMPLGYGYSWYIHGPYSTDLTAVAYQVIPEGIDSIEGKTLKAPYDAMISKVNAIENEMEGLKIGVVQWYELIASIAYWYKRGYTEETRAIEKIKETKPQFSEKQAQSAYKVYRSFKAVA